MDADVGTLHLLCTQQYTTSCVRTLRAGLVLTGASLCFSLWVTVLYPRPGGFFVRYGLVCLGVAITAMAVTSLLSQGSAARKWLRLVWLAGLAISFIGLFQLPRWFPAIMRPRNGKRAILTSPFERTALKKGYSDHASATGSTNDKVAAGRCHLCNIAPGAVVRLLPRR
jgi:hypothetical protein